MAAQKLQSDLTYGTSMIAASSSQIPPSVKPKVFMCLDGIVTEYDLSGDQRIGRASGADVPEIVIANRHVSRRHGQLRTDSDGVFYTADRTRNGVYLHGAPVLPGETTRLFDGDELQIPLGSDSEMQYATLVIALSWERIMLWESLIRASLDPLTGLSRRDTFISWWGTSHNNTDYQTACLFILDIDDFKLINDRYGHGAGDQALIQLAKTLCAHVRTPAQLCRWGGDEFIGIIPGDADKVLRRVENIRRSAGSLVIDEKIRFSISAGIADTALLADRTDVSGIVALADQALYRAKKSGKGTICIY